MLNRVSESIEGGLVAKDIDEMTRLSTQHIVLSDLFDGWNQGAFEPGSTSEMTAIKLGVLDAHAAISTYKSVDDLQQLKDTINKLDKQLSD
jgi:hypothetical protein